MSVAVVPMVERPVLAVELYDIQVRNRRFYDNYGVPLGELYPTAAHFRRDIEASLSGLAVPSTGLVVDFNAIVVDGVVVGGLDASAQPSNIESLTVGYYVDIEGGHGNRGYATDALRLKTNYLFATTDVEFLDAFTHPDNRISQKVLQNAGYELDRTYADQTTRRYIRQASIPE